MRCLTSNLPHEHFAQGREGPEAASLRRVWLFVFAITIHNLPEGMAVGVGFGANGLEGRYAPGDRYWLTETCQKDSPLRSP
ncbi:hypothetical protein [Vreelandella titanicae]|uniref:hypothetical protein n=1 Tax=Vreelandella titanicae TaxID=664683 RepID=UPI003D2B9E2E